MRSSTSAVRLLVLVAAGALAATILASSPKTTAIHGTADFEVFQCEDPAFKACYALSETNNANKRCAACKHWKRTVQHQNVNATLNSKKYVYANKGVRGNVVLADFNEEAWGASATAPRFRELYTDPEGHGYVEVPNSTKLQTGMVISYPQLAGVVAEPGVSIATTNVLYSSEKKRGELNFETVEDLRLAGTPKVLVAKAQLEKADALYWNVWTRNAALEPVAVLRPETEYEIFLDLAPFEYGAAATSSTASGDTRNLLNAWLARTPVSANLDAVLIPDDHFYDTGALDSMVTIDVGKIRSHLTNPIPRPEFPLTARATTGDSPFLFGTTARPFRVHTKNDFEGMADLTITMWRDIPLDEMTFTVCIAKEGDESKVCNDSKLLSHGFEPLAGVIGAPVQRVAGAVHIIARRDGERMFGVLHASNGPGFTHWQLNDTEDSLRRYVANIESSENAPQAARTLFATLFPGTTEQQAFMAIVNAQTSELDDQTPLLYFRLAGVHSLLPIPAGMMTVSTAHGEESVGARFAVLLPTERLDFSQYPTCVARWLPLYPDVSALSEDDDQLTPEKRAAFRARATLARWNNTAPSFPATDIAKFGHWLEAGDEAGGDVLVVLSHHNENQIYFDDVSKGLLPNIGRTFRAPAVAILNGCGTGGSVSNRFVKRLNDNGVDAVIATATNITFDLAADYFECLAGATSSGANGAPTTLGVAHFKALRCLAGHDDASRIPSKYGVRAYSFMLLGNSNVKICSPQ